LRLHADRQQQKYAQKEQFLHSCRLKIIRIIRKLMTIQLAQPPDQLILKGFDNFHEIAGFQ
jgi:hypothetical protein